MIRCPHCNVPLTVTETSRGDCPACGGALTGITTEPRSSWAEDSPGPQRYADSGFGDRPYRSIGAHYQPLASRWARLGSFLVDALLGLLAAGPGYGVMIYSQEMARHHGRGPDDKMMLGFLLLLLLAGPFAILQIVLLTTSGQSLGKKALGIRIVNYGDGGHAGFVKVILLRNLVPALIGAIPCAGSIFGLADPLFIFGDERRCLHDMIAGTKVVDASSPTREMMDTGIRALE